jgi:hypothetical protein
MGYERDMVFSTNHGITGKEYTVSHRERNGLQSILNTRFQIVIVIVGFNI